VVSVLAFDSAGPGCSAAVWRDGDILSRRSAPMERGQAEHLVPMIAAVLEEAGIPATRLDLIAVTTGPGAFTGLRIALAAARGLALASDVPVMGITSFAAVAAQVPVAERQGRRLVVALESKRAEFYLQAFGADGEPVGESALVAPIDCGRWLGDTPLLLAGDAAERLAAVLPERALARASSPGIPDAAVIARLAAATWRPGLRPPPPRPLYLRPPDTTQPRRGTVAR
jgi:tRNA threonylcarbamoyladenosine biosynthesis protein TsaB